MIQIKNDGWSKTIGEKLNDFRQRGMFCDLVIFGCEKHQCCDFVGPSLPNVHPSLVCSESFQNSSEPGCAEPEPVFIKNKLELCDDTVEKTCGGISGNVIPKCESLYAHSNVLAASSPVLQTEINAAVMKDALKKLHIHNIPFSIWENLLEFLYLGNVTVNSTTFTALEQVAKHLDINELASSIKLLKKSKKICENDNITIKDLDSLKAKTDHEQNAKSRSSKTKRKRLPIRATRQKKLHSGDVTDTKKRKTASVDCKRNISRKQSSKKKNVIEKGSDSEQTNAIECNENNKTIPSDDSLSGSTDMKSIEVLPELTALTQHEEYIKDLEKENETTANEIKSDMTEETEDTVSPCSDPAVANEDGMYECWICYKTFKSKYSRNIHLQNKHSRKFKEKIQPKCNICQKTFHTLKELKLHRKNVHPKGKLSPSDEAAWKCDHCPKTFTRKHDYFVHQRVHSGEKPYSCSHCGKRFSQKPNMIVHEKIHQEEKLFKCSHCDKTFLRKWGLQEHEKLHTGEKPFLCQTCGKAFAKVCNLQVHERIHTGEKPYKCPICPARFGDPSTRTQHQVIHKTEKAYQCTECGKQFSRPKSLKEHEHTHTGAKPYICPICNAGFANSSNLSRHKKFHLKKKNRKPTQKSKTLAPKLASQTLRVQENLNSIEEKKIHSETVCKVPTVDLSTTTPERPSLDSSAILKTPPVPDLSMSKLISSMQSTADYLDISNHSNFLLTPPNQQLANSTNTAMNLVNRNINSAAPMGGVNIVDVSPGEVKSQMTFHSNANIINQSASMSGILPHDVTLQPMGAGSMTVVSSTSATGVYHPYQLPNYSSATFFHTSL